MQITEAVTTVQRAAVQRLFASAIHGIAPNAVPAPEHDYLYAPVIAQARDEDGHLLGAALSCRAQVAAGSAILGSRGPYANVLDKHSELDLLAVEPNARGRGIGGALVHHLETRLASTGVRAWFGVVTADLQADQLEKFYRRHGFTITEPGQPLPNLLGKRWFPERGADEVAFYFYKRPAAQSFQ
ncbi:hypothetical protein GCM10025864_44950 [Luteimicrobium album]|uniref:N-acetyltransferase domain-containing protein n=1 Tax=Luteimicrobium album TaxID=1054550 RepID=A0ABQ6HUT8_9MICO|nr:GNAT family N-acetyltransferase [Luteimicrobium album]GMA22269.1 hypothetical protein GCM10025864_00280 [Luteimicrobium album]GMA26674.1 hypothetical protein GCM10025864_44330 [Luteimicrobium album]GMA26736.1 hypothetical protein GCM10025864_44950 [Luteimicrobium album]